MNIIQPRGWLELQFRLSRKVLTSIDQMDYGDYCPVGLCIPMSEVPTLNEFLDMITHRHQDFRLSRSACRGDIIAAAVSKDAVDPWVLVDPHKDAGLIMSDKIPKENRRVYGDRTNSLYLWNAPRAWKIFQGESN